MYLVIYIIWPRCHNFSSWFVVVSFFLFLVRGEKKELWVLQWDVFWSHFSSYGFIPIIFADSLQLCSLGTTHLLLWSYHWWTRRSHLGDEQLVSIPRNFVPIYFFPRIILLTSLFLHFNCWVELFPLYNHSIIIPLFDIIWKKPFVWSSERVLFHHAATSAIFAHD